MYSVISTTNLFLSAVARFESHSEAADYVSRLPNPDSYLIVAEA